MSSAHANATNARVGYWRLQYLQTVCWCRGSREHKDPKNKTQVFHKKAAGATAAIARKQQMKHDGTQPGGHMALLTAGARRTGGPYDKALGCRPADTGGHGHAPTRLKQGCGGHIRRTLLRGVLGPGGHRRTRADIWRTQAFSRIAASFDRGANRIDSADLFRFAACLLWISGN